jgi:hypothetical protein
LKKKIWAPASRHRSSGGLSAEPSRYRTAPMPAAGLAGTALLRTLCRPLRKNIERKQELRSQSTLRSGLLRRTGSQNSVENLKKNSKEVGFYFVTLLALSVALH